jgi:hypothetical protein
MDSWFRSYRKGGAGILPGKPIHHHDSRRGSPDCVHRGCTPCSGCPTSGRFCQKWGFLLCRPAFVPPPFPCHPEERKALRGTLRIPSTGTTVDRIHQTACTAGAHRAAGAPLLAGFARSADSYSAARSPRRLFFVILRSAKRSEGPYESHPPARQSTGFTRLRAPRVHTVQRVPHFWPVLPEVGILTLPSRVRPAAFSLSS